MSTPSFETVVACTCGSRDLAPASRGFRAVETRFGLRRCRRCGRMLLDPRPRPNAIAASYDADYYGAGTRKFVPLIENMVDRFRDGRARLARRLVAKIPPDGAGRVLDVGCGSGQFLARLSASGLSCDGTELSKETGRRASEVAGIRLHVGTLEPDTYPPGSFDLISIWHVLEHLPDPDHVLGLCARWIDERGALLVAVPNIDSWQARLFGGSWFHLDPPRHLFHFNRASLVAALGKAGFRVEVIRTLSWEQNLYGILQSALNVFGFPRDEFYEVLKGNRSLFGSSRYVLEAALMAALFIPASLLVVLEALSGHGGTLECVARKAVDPLKGAK